MFSAAKGNLSQERKSSWSKCYSFCLLRAILPWFYTVLQPTACLPLPTGQSDPVFGFANVAGTSSKSLSGHLARVLFIFRERRLSEINRGSSLVPERQPFLIICFGFFVGRGESCPWQRTKIVHSRPNQERCSFELWCISTGPAARTVGRLIA